MYIPLEHRSMINTKKKQLLISEKRQLARVEN